jgi:diguanylate cyclase (GGDEF)-like protein
MAMGEHSIQQASSIDALQREVEALRREVALLAKANAELERVAVRDTLTPLYNRRYFITQLDERIERMERYGARAAILFLDIDGLKRMNDMHGHGAGDFALVHAATILASHVRVSDVAARIGGDEFALILEEADEHIARAKAAQLAAMLEETDCDYDGATLIVRASIGLTVLQPGDRGEDAIGRADADMYATKRKLRG